MSRQRKVLEKIAFTVSMLEAGFTFQESLRRLSEESLIVSRDIAEHWQDLRKKVVAGENGALSSLRTFVRQLQLQEELEALVRKMNSLPLLQSIVCGGIFFLCLMSRLIFFGFFLANPDYLAFGLLILGTLLFLWIFISMKRDFWLVPWIHGLGLLEAKIESGKTLQQSLSEVPELRSLEKNPRLQKSPLFDPAQHSWTLVQEAALRGTPLLPLLRSSQNYLIEGLRQECEQRSLKLSFFFLIPLYGMFLPANLLIILGPMLQSFQTLPES
jgi:hypothetical protein